jgi:hypothetical protein
MIQPKIQEVYAYNGVHTIRQKGFFFSPSEFEQFKREFGKELLEKASENVRLICSIGYCSDCENHWRNKESITEVLDDYLLNNKI